MKVIVEGSPEEIAALVLALQERQGELSETISVEFPFVDGANAYAHNKKGYEFMGNVTFTAFGKEVKKRLVDINQNQAWLICQVKERTGLYCDSSYMHKILTGRCNTPSIVRAICEILGIPDVKTR